VRERSVIDCDLGKGNWLRRSFLYETLALGREESSFDHTRDSHSRRCDGIIARLVQMPEAYWAAIAILVMMQSTLGATLALSACIDSLKSQSESSLLWLSWRCGQNINGLHPIARDVRFVSLERGVVRSLLRSIQKSSDRLVVTQREAG